MLQVSPKGTVPILILPNGRVIEQSLGIMLWVLQQNDTGLLPKDPGTQKEILALIAKNDGELKKNLDRYKYPKSEIPDSQKTARAGCELFLQELEDRLQDTSFLFGDKITHGDLAILPFVRQFFRIEPKWFKTVSLPKLFFYKKISDLFGMSTKSRRQHKVSALLLCAGSRRTRNSSAEFEENHIDIPT